VVLFVDADDAVDVVVAAVEAAVVLVVACRG
jgi:hypothetical protein